MTVLEKITLSWVSISMCFVIASLAWPLRERKTKELEFFLTLMDRFALPTWITISLILSMIWIWRG